MVRSYADDWLRDSSSPNAVLVSHSLMGGHCTEAAGKATPLDGELPDVARCWSLIR